ncbi:hypothetical protein GJAV_G00143550 [Gymnothorax javanicus]|nr:hypothetical protein GJAV_G00143550 [Gymnothorax javanicus]
MSAAFLKAMMASITQHEGEEKGKMGGIQSLMMTPTFLDYSPLIRSFGPFLCFPVVRNMSVFGWYGVSLLPWRVQRELY